ncbi:MAG: MFS transporter [Parachlamydia sp.]|nr:MAG: MFS transporter [Parachlamydia sp.]
MTNAGQKHLSASLYTVLFVAFIDNLGLGLIYPLFSAMLFDHSLNLVPLGTTAEIRGIWLGVLIALMPLAQFFCAPLWGSLSDSQGRKQPLFLSVGVALLGYLIALGGVAWLNIWCLLLSRLVIGAAAGNMSIVQAAIADLSRQEDKTKNFGLYSMALGGGFTLGPFFGGLLSALGYHAPFVFAFFLTLLNLIFVAKFFSETHQMVPCQRKLRLGAGLNHLKKAFHLYGLRTILICSFLHNFGWSYFFEFTPVYLIARFQFSPMGLGFFYGAAGCFYAISTGLLIRPFSKRLQPEVLFFGGNSLAAFAILLMPFLPTSQWIWPWMFVICYFVAFVTPSLTALVSSSVDAENQGEALGILSSINAAALVFSPLLSGSFVGAYPALPMKLGGMAMLAASGLILVSFRNKTYSINFKRQAAKTQRDAGWTPPPL